MDERFFADRSRACAPKLFRISYLILGNAADCEDAMQDALLKAWRYRATLRDEMLFDTWLIRILINESRTLLRRRAARAEAQIIGDPAHAAPPEDEDLRDAVLALPVHLRVPLILHHMEGYTQSEIAHMLRVPLPTVKSRLHRARKHLKAELEEVAPR